MLTEAQFRIMREQMVREQILGRGITNPLVVDAMRRVPRHHFVPPHVRADAYRDGPLPIGQNQTISQPYIVGLMTQLLALKGGERVLEIGTGCGYQTAILCEIAEYVYTLERFPQLADHAAQRLSDLGYANVDIHIGDGSQGLTDMSPFDVILVTAAAPMIPGPLVSQLRHDGGRLVIPVGDRRHQRLQVIHRLGKRHTVQRSDPVRFVPMIGRYGFKDAESGTPSVV